MKAKVIVIICVFVVTLMAWATPVAAEQGEESRIAPAPGTALMVGAGPYYSVPCSCFDRGVWSVQWLGRLHFGDMGALEAGMYTGTMLLGGRFPSRGWSGGVQVSLLPQSDDRWWDGLSAKSGYRRWEVSGMRASGAHGMYGGLNWAVEIFPYVNLEADVTAYRAFREMSHWSFEGSMGLGLRL